MNQAPTYSEARRRPPFPNVHGPLGLIARTAEYDNNDAADNRDTYYLRDAMGGHVGLLTDHDDSPATEAQFSFTTYDAFGNAMRPGRPPTQAGSFAWRGAEGSVYDPHPTLVFMQARLYDPTTGWFIQPDALPLASMTTQGMNNIEWRCIDTSGTSIVLRSHCIDCNGSLLLASVGSDHDQ